MPCEVACLLSWGLVVLWWALAMGEGLRIGYVVSG